MKDIKNEPIDNLKIITTFIKIINWSIFCWFLNYLVKKTEPPQKTNCSSKAEVMGIIKDNSTKNETELLTSFGSNTS